MTKNIRYSPKYFHMENINKPIDILISSKSSYYKIFTFLSTNGDTNYWNCSYDGCRRFSFLAENETFRLDTTITFTTATSVAYFP